LPRNGSDVIFVAATSIFTQLPAATFKVAARILKTHTSRIGNYLDKTRETPIGHSITIGIQSNSADQRLPFHIQIPISAAPRLNCVYD